MAIAKYAKGPTDRKRYQIDYSDWLDTGEVVINVIFSIDEVTSPALVIDDVMVLPTGLGVQYYCSGGVVGTYRVLATLTTSVGPQVRQDEIFFTVREP